MEMCSVGDETYHIVVASGALILGLMPIVENKMKGAFQLVSSQVN